jgi:hypothetical protein
MATSNFPNTSFMNLFSQIVYDMDCNPNPSLDIWDAYEIGQFYKKQLSFFQPHKISATDTWVSLARYYYNDERLWWVIPLFNDITDPFVVMNPTIFMSQVQEVMVLQAQYMNQLLLLARQQKIQSDSDFNKGLNS